MPVSTDDYVAVADHLARYCWKVDTGDIDGWAELWTEDGIFRGTGPKDIVGREALRNVPAGVKQSCGNRMVHLAGNLYCDYGENNDTIIAHFYNYVTTWLSGAPGTPSVLARSVATLVRNGDGWLIQMNHVDMLTGA